MSVIYRPCPEGSRPKHNCDKCDNHVICKSLPAYMAAVIKGRKVNSRKGGEYSVRN